MQKRANYDCGETGAVCSKWETSIDLDLTGKRALITGSTKGIGLATAGGLARMGAQIIVHGRAAISVERASADLRRQFPDASIESVAADLEHESGYQEIYGRVEELDILVNNLGVYQQRSFWETPDEEWTRLFNVNVLAGVRLTRHYLPAMLKQNWGRIVNVSSESGAFIPTEMIHYGVSKAAQLAFSRGTAELTRATGVTVNSVLPGPTMVETTRTQLEARANARNETAEVLARETFEVRKPSSLLQRYTTPEEVANMICYLCSPAASATNGAPVRVDGGIVKSFV